VKENFCDGLGACLGNCPTDALKVIEAEVDAYDEKGVINHIKKNAPDMLEAHVAHIKEHADELDEETLKAAGIKKEDIKGRGHGHSHDAPHNAGSACGCPSAATMAWGAGGAETSPEKGGPSGDVPSELRQWPIQLKLVNPMAPYFALPGGTNLVVAADCAPFAYANFHRDFLKGKTVAIGCPKLDDIEYYVEKLTDIFKSGNIKTVETIMMEVPCCSALGSAVDAAIKASGKKIAHVTTVIGIKGDLR
jgi:ferredoxin